MLINKRTGELCSHNRICTQTRENPAHGKRLHVPPHQGDTNKKHRETPAHPHQDGTVGRQKLALAPCCWARSRSYTPGCTPMRSESRFPSLHTHIHSLLIHSSQQGEAPVSIEGSAGQQNELHMVGHFSALKRKGPPNLRTSWQGDRPPQRDKRYGIPCTRGRQRSQIRRRRE